jgi:hypothetical protein
VDAQIIWLAIVGLALQTATLALVPVAPIAIGSRLVNRYHDARSSLSPGIEVLAVASGIYFGLVLFVGNMPAGYLTLELIFQDGGPWDLTLVSFLTERANPFAYSLAPIFEHIYAEEGTFHVHPGLHLFSVTAVVVVVGPYLRWRNRRALANGMRNLLILLWGAYATVYLMGLLFWMFNIFNFWTFLLVVVIVQLIRR